MARGIIAGGTDYSHQSLNDIIDDLTDELKILNDFLKKIETNKSHLQNNNYWRDKVSFDLKNIFNYSIRFISTTIEEIEDIRNELNINVELHHYTRLKKISNVANKLNRDIGKIWSNDFSNKVYSNSDFRKVEEIYYDIRNQCSNLLDFSNMAQRLEDFIGRRRNKQTINNNWISGSFYVFLFLVVIIAFSAIINFIPWYLLPIVIIGGLLFIVVIGALQLKNDSKISDESFTTLIIEAFKNLPFLK